MSGPDGYDILLLILTAIRISRGRKAAVKGRSVLSMNLATIGELIGFVLLGQDTGVYGIITGVLFIFGLWGILQKGGIPGWWALVPCVRYAKLGEAAGRDVSSDFGFISEKPC